jgi:hypothetical protein
MGGEYRMADNFFSSVSATLHREEAAAAAARAERDPRYNQTKRVCLGCRKSFLSKWAGNRMCEECSS